MLDLINNEFNHYINTIENYNELEITNIFDFDSGVEPGSKNYSETQQYGYAKFYRVGDMNSKCKTFIPSDLTKNKIVTEEDVLVSFDATIGRVAYGLDGAYSTGMKKITISKDYQNEIDNSIVFAYFNNKNVQDIINQNARGTTILHAGSSINFMKFKYNKEKLCELNKTISVMFKKMIKNKKENETLLKLRDTLLPKLMNGEIDLENIEI